MSRLKGYCVNIYSDNNCSVFKLSEMFCRWICRGKKER